MVSDFAVVRETEGPSANSPRYEVKFQVEGKPYSAVILTTSSEFFVVSILDANGDDTHDISDVEALLFSSQIKSELKEIVLVHLKKSLSEEEREFARAILFLRGQSDYKPGGFRVKLVDAALSADRSNRARLYSAFPDLKWPMEALDTEIGNERIFDLLNISPK